MDPPKHRTSIARIRVATPAQLRLVEKLLMEVQSWPKIQNMVGPVEARSWPKRWQCGTDRIQEQRG